MLQPQKEGETMRKAYCKRLKSLEDRRAEREPVALILPHKEGWRVVCGNRDRLFMDDEAAREFARSRAQSIIVDL